MAVPKFEEFFRPVLGLTLEGPISLADCRREAPDVLEIGARDREERTRRGNTTKVIDRVNWSVTYLFQAGLIQRTGRGVYAATELGRTTYSANPGGISRDVLRQSEGFRDFERQSGDPGGVETPTVDEIDSSTPLERIEAAAAELNAALRAELLNHILEASSEFFEKLIVDLMLAMGYGSTGSGEHLGRSSDGGVDGVIRQDKLGLDSIYLQAKRYGQEQTVPVTELRSFSGTLDEKRAAKGVFVTTSNFTSSGRQHAERSTKNIVLIDGTQLAKLMVEHGVGVRTTETIALKRLDEDYFIE